MDAVEFLKEYKRMCSTFDSCSDCKIERFCTYEKGSAVMIVKQDEPYESEMIVKAVEEWAKEHPVKTRQTEFLKIFPKAKVAIADNREVVLAICPKQIDNTFTIPSCIGEKCVECEKDYWLQEVE